ncbi:DUF4331 domain-containing protein [Tahibacter amnicola]|uniref:DUF4331 domain-containing protein n=1 Tax=Tahibacter amnicola TaxID=2976241 RepID=A0ABY6BI00_9GAMM|nr:DUF4331 domain-containing protein [Tahibacter amnicola]UXI69480.1 DUF4331 domain-containing protein [Tahibacter amnicola]
MKSSTTQRLMALVQGVAVSVASLLCSTTAMASDHRESPEIVNYPTADIGDFWAFISPSDPSKLVFVMAVNPYAVPLISKSYIFSPDIRYVFKIDSDNDARADSEIVSRFSKENAFAHPDGHGGLTTQTFRTTFSMGLAPLVGKVTPTTQVRKTPLDPIILQGRDGTKAFAGLRDDPFFFDLVASDRTFSGMANGFRTKTDRFAWFAVSALVVEIPLASVYRGQPLRLWATTEELGQRGWKQIQRVGNPAVKGVYIPENMTERFNASEPHNDVRDFKAVAEQSARTMFGLQGETLDRLMGIIIPDTLTLDPTQPTKSPNGRALDDDLDLMFWFNLHAPIAYAPGDLDGVHGNDVPNSTTFPYLAPPIHPQ